MTSWLYRENSRDGQFRGKVLCVQKITICLRGLLYEVRLIVSEKLTYECVKRIFEDSGFKLESNEYIGNKSCLDISDKEGYFYKVTYGSVRNGYKPLKFIGSNPHTIHNIHRWCKLNNKSFELCDEKYIKNQTQMRWLCFKCGDVFRADWASISSNAGCAVCAGKQLGNSNSLTSKYPDLCKEWNYLKNGEITPDLFTYGSGKKVWWKCKNNHEWQSVISSRTSLGCGCPYCSGLLPSPEYNLFKNNPNLCKEWNYDKNQKHPTEFTPKTAKKVWWRCDNCSFEWLASISHRNNGRGCPRCLKSRGERQIEEWLIDNKIKYTSQKAYDGLLGLKNKPLSYDFYLDDYNLLLEYQGEYHDGTARNQTKKQFESQEEHDCRKRRYAEIHNIKLLEIWYQDFEKINEILYNELKIKNTQRKPVTTMCV